MVEELDYSPLAQLLSGKEHTQNSFATAVGISQGHLSEVVNNKKRVSMPLFLRMAKALGMTGADLLKQLEDRKFANSEKTA